jgi:sugar lactone lactonase YvrE
MQAAIDFPDPIAGDAAYSCAGGRERAASGFASGRHGKATQQGGRTMRTLCAAALSMMLAASSFAAEPSEVWRAEGLSNPESVAFDPAARTLYVSNVAGDPATKDGKGFISKLSPDGKIVQLEWATQLHAPKGMALVGERIFVSDIDRLVAINTKSGAVSNAWPAAGAKFLNDVAADAQGRVFVSDMLTNQIWLLDGDSFAVWLEDAKLENPNGLKVAGDKLIVASWGAMEPDWSTKVPGHLLAIDIASKTIGDLGDPKPVGNLDGLEPDGAGGWYISDWAAGALYHAGPDGRAEQIMDLAQGSADIGIIADDKILLVPMMMDGTVVAYKME